MSLGQNQGQKSFRVPPQNLEAEKALLGSIMLRPETLHEIVDIVNPAIFYSEKHSLICKTILELWSGTNPVDLLSVSSRLKETAGLDQVGGTSYIADLVNVVPSAGNVRYYAELVNNKYLLRRLIDASHHIMEMGFDEAGDLDEILDRAEKKIFEVTNMTQLKSYLELKEALGEAWERLDALHKSKAELRGITTGFRDLDIARQTAVKSNTSVCIFSLEMSAQQLVDRMLAAEAQVNSWNLRTGRITSDDDFLRIRNSLDRLSTAPIYIDDMPGNNILKMRSVARRVKSEKNLGLIVVDYLQLMVPTNSRGSDSTVQQVTEISRSLKNLARELDVPVLALSQLNRAVEQRGGRPRLSDLRDSGCLAGDTLLTLADSGRRGPIRELAGKSKIRILAMKTDRKIQSFVASKIFASGTKQTFELSLRSGRFIKASANHQFLTLQGWKRLDELKQGERIASPRKVSKSRSGGKMRNEELILLAHLLGDGCVLPKQPIHYTSADPANIEVVTRCAKTMFNINARLVQQENWWHVYLKSPFRLAPGRKHPVTDWYSGMDISLVRSYEKRIPSCVFEEPDEKIALFLRHLWATDGNISYKILPGRKVGAVVYYASTSKELAYGVQHLLLRLGIWGNVRKILQGKYRPIYQVHIQSAPVILKFLKIVGCYGKRGNIVSDLIRRLEEINTNPNTDVFPKEIWGFVSSEKDKTGMSWRDIARGMQVSYNGSSLMATGVSPTRLVRIAKVLNSELLLHLAESELYWDEIRLISPLGQEEVFDATVPGAHNFVANDIVVHNSIEQDADVVMFIHREDKYKEDSLRPNIAEILVEKHRNGPVGKVELYFDDKKTTFVNLEKSDFSEFSGTPGNQGPQEVGAF